MKVTILGYAKTYPSSCRDCGARIFVHTNGDGGWVLFDELGQPWPVHRCYRPKSSGITRVEADHLYEDEAMDLQLLFTSLFGQQETTQRLTRVRRPTTGSYSMKPTARIQDKIPPPEQPLDIERCEPKFFVDRTLKVSGYISDVHGDRTIERFAQKGSISYAFYLRLIGSEKFSQITVVDSDFVSYTVLVPFLSSQLQIGSMISLSITGNRTLSDPLFLCKSLEIIRLDRLGSV